MMLVLVVYTFSVAVYTVATGASTEAKDLTVGIVDEDRSGRLPPPRGRTEPAALQALF
jgi:hypothetical protein